MIQYAFLTSVLDEGEGRLHALGALPIVERDPGTHWIGSWVGPRASLGKYGEETTNPFSLQGIQPRFLSRPARNLSLVPLNFRINNCPVVMVCKDSCPSA
jgi:hypothetical protein